MNRGESPAFLSGIFQRLRDDKFMSTDFEYTTHYSVLKRECLDYLVGSSSSTSGCFLDLTFGGGGHSSAILDSDPKFNMVAVDQDPEAIKNGQIVVKKYYPRLQLLDMSFDQFPDYFHENRESMGLVPPDGFQGILMDLGVSSHHFDSGERGFSFRYDSQLDMRMDCDNDCIPTAAELVNNLSVEELTEIFTNYGEERYAKRIAEYIAEERGKNPIVQTSQLENIAFHAYPKRYRHGKTHPATRIFQALRIAVNRELEQLEQVVPRLAPLLATGGRLAIISFHSLEDRIAKLKFKELARQGDDFSILTKKPLIPTDQEIKENSRSRSAKLRVLEKQGDIDGA
jgi:16S rRNA (cytosine1402-N4)-methyltransferase